MRLTVWRAPLTRTHTTSLLSRATAFHILLALLTLLPPLLLAYRSQGFWLRAAEYREQPDIHFRHELLLLADTAAGQQLGWATFPVVVEQLLDSVRIPVVRSREEDSNRDGVLDGLELELELPLRQDEQVVSCTALLLLDVRLRIYSEVHLTGLVVLQGGGYPGAALAVTGDVELVQRELLPHRGRHTRYTASPVPASELPEDFALAGLLSRYQARNLTTRLANSYTVWQPGPAGPQFSLTASLRYPVQTLRYQPGFWQVIKWGWVQYLAILVVFLGLGNRLREFVFSEQILPTVVTQNKQ